MLNLGAKRLSVDSQGLNKTQMYTSVCREDQRKYNSIARCISLFIYIHIYIYIYIYT